MDRRVSGLAVVILLSLCMVAASAFRADAATVNLRNNDGPHCASDGGTRLYLALRTKDAIDPGSIRLISSVWTQTNVVGATNSWMLRLKGPRPVAPETVKVVTSEGTLRVAVPGFDAPCPVLSPARSSESSGGTPVSVEAANTAKPAQAVAAPRRSAAIGGSLPFTGMGTIQLLPIGAFCLCAGLLLVFGPRRPTRRDALRYDGRFIA